MLQKLTIRNYAIIDHLTIEPDAQLSIVTGETGAGKSIILGALSLILGERADTSVLIDKNDKCVVEACFDVKGHHSFFAALEEEELDKEDQCIIRREISSSGKSRAFVNDTPVNLGTLNKLTSLLVDLHQQFDHLAIRDDNFQMEVLDAVAKNGSLKQSYQSVFREHQSLSKTLAVHQETQSKFRQEADYKQFLLDELLQAAFRENEIEDAELRLKQMAHTERIQQVLTAGYSLLEEGEQPLVNELKRVLQQLQGIVEFYPEAQPLLDRVVSAHAELKDIAGEFETLQGRIDADPEAMQRLQERMDLGYKLFKKHGLRSTEELIVLQQQLEADLQQSLNLGDTIEALEKQIAALYDQLRTIGAQLSEQRMKTAPGLSSKVNELLHLVGMPNAAFKIDVTDLDEPLLSGMNAVQFLLDANKKGQFLPIHKTASGGEMSRIMLSIKSITAEAMELPTLIFDEVDTGISGEAAKQVGILLQDLARYHQVICITHQPQVAARGQQHLFVYKESANGVVQTRVRALVPEEKVVAIARMIGGEKPSDAALQNARELVEG